MVSVEPTKEEQARLFDPEQRKRGMPEPFDEILGRWVEKQYSTFTMVDACMDGLGLTPDKLTPALVTRVGIALRKMGCGRDENRGAGGADGRRGAVRGAVGDRRDPDRRWNVTVQAVVFDFGGVFIDSPFDGPPLRCAWALVANPMQTSISNKTVFNVFFIVIPPPIKRC